MRIVEGQSKALGREQEGQAPKAEKGRAGVWPRAPPKGGYGCWSRHRDALGQIAGFIHVQALAHRHRVAQQLQGHHRQRGGEHSFALFVREVGFIYKRNTFGSHQ